MAVFVRDVRVLTGAAELSGQIRAVGLEFSAEPLDATVLGSTTRQRVGGLKNAALSHEGFWDAAPASSQIDALMFDRIGVSGAPITVTPQGSSEGALAYFFEAVHVEYTPRGAMGELFGYNVSAQADRPLNRGVVARNQTVLGSSNSTGPGVQLGSSTDRVARAHLHVLGVAAATTDPLTMTIQSANSSAFTSPVTRISFTATTVSTAQVAEFAAGTTHTWWRALATSPTSSGKYNVVVALAIST